MYDALLFRLNPIYWPYWHDDIAQDREPYPLLEVGPHLERSKLCAGIPVIALGTDGLGIVAVGETVSNVEDCADDDLRGVAPEDRIELEKGKVPIYSPVSSTEIFWRLEPPCLLEKNAECTAHRGSFSNS